MAEPDEITMHTMVTINAEQTHNPNTYWVRRQLSAKWCNRRASLQVFHVATATTNNAKRRTEKLRRCTMDKNGDKSVR